LPFLCRVQPGVARRASKVARLEFTIKKAESVTRDLSEERQLSDRIHQEIRSLRGRKPQVVEDKAKTGSSNS
jgi:hypothetical protein